MITLPNEGNNLAEDTFAKLREHTGGAHHQRAGPSHPRHGRAGDAAVAPSLGENNHPPAPRVFELVTTTAGVLQSASVASLRRYQSCSSVVTDSA